MQELTDEEAAYVYERVALLTTELITDTTPLDPIEVSDMCRQGIDELVKDFSERFSRDMMESNIIIHEVMRRAVYHARAYLLLKRTLSKMTDGSRISKN